MNIEINTILLSIQSAGKNNYRLGISVKDSLHIFKCRGQAVEIHIPGLKIIKCRTTCGNPCGDDGNWISINPETGKSFRKKGYDLYNLDLSNWLRELPERKSSIEWSKKLSFSFSTNPGVIKLVFCRF
mgnify:FL=1